VTDSFVVMSDLLLIVKKTLCSVGRDLVGTCRSWPIVGLLGVRAKRLQETRTDSATRGSLLVRTRTGHLPTASQWSNFFSAHYNSKETTRGSSPPLHTVLL